MRNSTLLTFAFGPGGLTITPTTEGIARAKELAEDTDYSPDDHLHTMLEDHLGNGWMEIEPKVIGALTDAPIISEDFTVNDAGDTVPTTPDARVYAFMNYQVEDPVATWAEGKPTFWQKG